MGSMYTWQLYVRKRGSWSVSSRHRLPDLEIIVVGLGMSKLVVEPGVFNADRDLELPRHPGFNNPPCLHTNSRHFELYQKTNFAH